MSFGIYVHWPYCSRICPYCDFNVYRARDQDEAPLLDAMIADLRGHRERVGPRVAETLFLGGGTPSLLSANGISRLIDATRGLFALSAESEITLEANPDERATYANAVAAGVNRISIGVQSLRDEALKMLGRSHDAVDARDAVEAAASTGARVSVDLIYARPGQSVDEWRSELREALALPAEHLSLYQLTIEQRTAFGAAAARGDLTVPNADGAADLYEATQDLCALAGAPAYEISNHARGDAARARHNMIYWRGGDWIGVGPGAHGRAEMAGVRVATEAHARPRAYTDAVNANGVGWEASESLSDDARAKEALLMGLRTIDGVPRSDVSTIIDPERARTLEQAGLLLVRSDRLALTPKGRLLADRVATDLLKL